MNNDPTALPFPTAGPSHQAGVYWGLTSFLVSIYGCIFVLVYVQLVLILYYKYKRFSYQTGFLFLSLFWASLRIWLFSFYFKNAADANMLPFVVYFILYCLPVFLQFCTLCLLVLYYGQVYFKIATRQERKSNNLKLRVCLYSSVLIFLLSSLASAFYIRELCNNGDPAANCNIYQITLARMFINDSLFVIFGFLLSGYLFKLAKLSMDHLIPEQNNITILKATIVTIFTSFSLISRTLYNLLAIAIDSLKLPDFGFDWINVSDQADLVNLNEAKKFITFCVVLLIWEIIPTFAIIMLFRIKTPTPSLGFSKNQHLSFQKPILNYPYQEQNSIRGASMPDIFRKSTFIDSTSLSGQEDNNNEDIGDENQSLASFKIKSNNYSSINF